VNQSTTKIHHPYLRKTEHSIVRHTTFPIYSDSQKNSQTIKESSGTREGTYSVYHPKQLKNNLIYCILHPRKVLHFKINRSLQKEDLLKKQNMYSHSLKQFIKDTNEHSTGVSKLHRLFGLKKEELPKSKKHKPRHCTLEPGPLILKGSSLHTKQKRKAIWLKVQD
jgi:hypothetical protein